MRVLRNDFSLYRYTELLLVDTYLLARGCISIDKDWHLTGLVLVSSGKIFKIFHLLLGLGLKLFLGKPVCLISDGLRHEEHWN